MFHVFIYLEENPRNALIEFCQISAFHASSFNEDNSKYAEMVTLCSERAVSYLHTKEDEYRPHNREPNAYRQTPYITKTQVVELLTSCFPIFSFLFQFKLCEFPCDWLTAAFVQARTQPPLSVLPRQILPRTSVGWYRSCSQLLLEISFVTEESNNCISTHFNMTQLSNTIHVLLNLHTTQTRKA